MLLTPAAVAGTTVVAVAGTPYNFSWTGAPTAPQPWHPQTLNDWDLLVHQQEMSNGSTFQTGVAQDGSNCSAPPATHSVNNENDAVFICNNQLQTTTGNTGLGVLAMAPAQLADFSSGPVSISWRVSSLRTTDRDWIEIDVSPFTDNVIAPADTSVDLEGVAVNTARCVMTDTPPSVWDCTVYINGALAYDSGFSSPGIEDTLQAHGLTPSDTTLLRYQLDLSTARLHLWLPDLNQTLIDMALSSPPLPFTRGVVQLSEQTHAPGKNCSPTPIMSCFPLQGTWHWSDFSISNAIPFSMMRLAPSSNGVFGGGSSTVTFNLPRAAPAGSYLRFLGSPGDKITYSTNGSPFQPAPIQHSTSPNQSNDKNFFFSIPAGTTTVSFQGQDWAGGPWVVEDPSVWSLTLSAPNMTPRVALPALANAAYGGYTTVDFVENLGTATAVAEVEYFDASGKPSGLGDFATIPVNGTWVVRQDDGNAFPSGGAGSGVILSDQPLAVAVNELAPGGGDATSYSGLGVGSGTGSTLFAPAIANGAYGGYTTGIGLINSGATPTNITVTYRDTSGSVVKTQPVSNVLPNAYLALYSGDPALGLPAGFSGTATIASSGSALAGVVNETGPGGQFSSYDAIPAGAPSLVAPVALRNAFGGFNTGTAIQNTSGTAGTVTITYYNGSGSSSQTSHPIAANGYLGIYQGTDIPADGAYTARITSDVAIAAIVNEVAPPSGGGQQSTAYNTLTAGAASVHLPIVESSGPDGFSTGQGVMNTGTVPTTVTVTYYDTASGAPIGTAQQSPSLQPNAFWGLYQPSGGLASGTRATAVVTTSSGGQVAVVCNESSPSALMSYVGQ